MADGFEVSGLDEFTKDMLSLAQETLPKESKKFLKKNANQLKTASKKKAKSLGIIENSGSFYNGFKSGKVYKYSGNLSCRAINNSPHAHLLENGHLQTNKDGTSVGKGFVPGFHYMQRATEEFQNKYYENCESFIDDMLKNKGL